MIALLVSKNFIAWTYSPNPSLPPDHSATKLPAISSIWNPSIDRGIVEVARFRVFLSMLPQVRCFYHESR